MEHTIVWVVSEIGHLTGLGAVTTLRPGLLVASQHHHCFVAQARPYFFIESMPVTHLKALPWCVHLCTAECRHMHA